MPTLRKDDVSLGEQGPYSDEHDTIGSEVAAAGLNNEFSKKRNVASKDSALEIDESIYEKSILEKLISTTMTMRMRSMARDLRIEIAAVAGYGIDLKNY